MARDQVMDAEKDTLSVFLSYSRSDREAADAIVEGLEARGMRAFLYGCALADGSADEVFHALENLLSIYDPGWLASAPQPAGAAPHLPPPGTLITQPLDPDKPLLPEPRHPEIFLNDLVVIE